jgi:methylenetetrahydrofolate dehydrogenase (NADP+)/methenyltetrahydrofolate cyclohydrolase
MLFSGQQVAGKIFTETRECIKREGLRPGLGVILVGDDAPSHLYVGIKERRAKELGIRFYRETFPADVSAETILQTIHAMNTDEDIHGIIVQLPLPACFDTDAIIGAIDPAKDTDGFHPETLEAFLAGDDAKLPVFPRALLALATAAKEALQAPKTGAALALVNSALMGEVLTRALQTVGYNATYITDVADEEAIKNAAVIISATGKAASVSTEALAPQAVVIDGGISYDDKGRVIGDVRRSSGVYRDDILVTPVPGGVGPVTVAVLLARVTEAALQYRMRSL